LSRILFRIANAENAEFQCRVFSQCRVSMQSFFCIESLVLGSKMQSMQPMQSFFTQYARVRGRVRARILSIFPPVVVSVWASAEMRNVKPRRVEERGLVYARSGNFFAFLGE